MSQKKEITEAMEALNSLRDLAENYEEIAANRMQKIKDTVLLSRDFLTELSEVYVDIKSSYEKEVLELFKRRKKGDKELKPYLQKNGRTLMVYMSSNGKLFGPVTKKTFVLFDNDLKDFNEKKADIIIIGHTGREMFESIHPEIKFEFFDLSDDNISTKEIKDLMKKFLQYEKVHIYHGKFKNVVRQNANLSSITGEEIFETETPSEIPKEDRFIFEPTLEKIILFFETQIMSTLFKQTFFENQLARQASRVNSMEEALIHIEEEEKRLNKEKIRIKHIVQNKKQLETISGFVLWDIT
jgi:ATP synthase F1 gamma subunit